MADTHIEWADKVWNPIAGCNDKSEGCRNCYARGMARRLEAMGQEKYKGLTVLQGSHVVWTGKITFDKKALLQPLSWMKPKRIFVNSMSDLFHENVTRRQLLDIAGVMVLAYWHTFQVLTKRPENAKIWAEIVIEAIEIMRAMQERGGIADPRVFRALDMRRRDNVAWVAPLPNMWMGVSVENQKAADERIPLLLQIPAAKRFLSVEPLLGPVSLRWKDSGWGIPHPRHLHPKPDADGRVITDEYDGLRELDWVIVGGESGPHARPMLPDWARTLRDECKAAGVAYFFKQWGEWVPTADPEIAKARGIPLNDCMSYVGKKAAGALLDGIEYKNFPQENQ